MLRPVDNPPNPWASTALEYLEEIPPARLAVFEERSTSILSRNDEARVGFAFGVNPYRGCQHACSYCNARRYHELLGLGAGTDFDAKIVVKPRAPVLLQEALDAPGWRGDVLVFSGATDCYQPIEASYRLTRACLEVCAAYRNPVAIITKGALIERDLTLLRELHDAARLTATISIPVWDETLARTIEPLAPSPRRRMRTVQKLAAAGLDVGVAISPLILGVGEDDLGALLTAAKDAGARRATMGFLRTDGSVEAVFTERTKAELPLRAPRILGRMVPGGHAHPAEAVVERLFGQICKRLGLAFTRAGDDRSNTPPAGPAELRTFRRPPRAGQQLGLFGG